MDTKSTSMKGGDGLHSYYQNSWYQRSALELAKALLDEVIAEKLDIKQLSPSHASNLFRIADLGCSVGPNTFIAVQNIVEAVKLKLQASNPKEEALEFQVFFNDHVSNDFNTLFKSLPLDKQYFAAGVPGPFQGRLFPRASIDFFHSSYALHWLLSTPKELLDKNSPAYNKGRISYSSAPSEVVEAYSSQFAKELESFLSSRAEELVSGGLMAILLVCLPEGVSPSQCSFFVVGDLLLEASLFEMAKMGLLSEEKVDSFNIPKYYPTPQELLALIERNSCFSIERVEKLPRSRKPEWALNVEAVISNLRAIWEGLVTEHFGDEIIDELFDRLCKKIPDALSPSQTANDNAHIELFVLLKRN